MLKLIHGSDALLTSVGEMGPEFSPKMAAKSLTSQQIVRIHQLFRQAKFDDPSGDVSSWSMVLSYSVHFISMSFSFSSLF
jgi:hypothetical protein